MRSGIIYQQLQIKHLQSIYQISKYCFADPKEHLNLSFLMPLWLSSQRFWGRVAIYEHQVIGYIILDINRAGAQADLLSLAVLPDFQGQGIAQILLDQSLQECSTMIQEIFLEVRTTNLAAHHLYEGRGFTQINLIRNYYGPTEDAYVYKRALSAIPQPLQAS